MQEGTLFGFGTSHVKDTYLSPFNYSGWGGHILNERMTFMQSRHFSRQRIIRVDISSTKNPAENVNDFGAFVDYSLGYHYHLVNGEAFKLLTGAQAQVTGGFIYNTRNGNNPLSAKVDIDLGLSIIAFYTLRINNYPLVFRYQGEVPFVGVFFAPPYRASYYEIFNEGNASDIIALNSFNNKLSLQNYVTIDIPIHTSTLRLGYLNSLYNTDIKDIQTHIYSNTFMIGWVKEFYLK
jgi:hypothetical protein